MSGTAALAKCTNDNGFTVGRKSPCAWRLRELKRYYNKRSKKVATASYVLGTSLDPDQHEVSIMVDDNLRVCFADTTLDVVLHQLIRYPVFLARQGV